MILKFLCVWKGGGVVFDNLNSIILALWNVIRLGKIQFGLGEIKKIYKSHRVIGGGGRPPNKIIGGGAFPPTSAAYEDYPARIV